MFGWGCDCVVGVVGCGLGACGGYSSDGFRSKDFGIAKMRFHIRIMRVFIIILIGILSPMHIVAPSLQDLMFSARYQC